MGVEAVTRHPERSRKEVLDELIADLDQRLGHIVTETAGQHGATRGRTPDAPRRGWLRRMFGRDG
jgi:hypothetical protein